MAGILYPTTYKTKEEKYELLQKNLVNFDLIPYHSKNFTLNFEDYDPKNDRWNEKMNVIKTYVDVTMELIKKSEIKYLIIQGKQWGTLFKHSIIPNKRDESKFSGNKNYYVANPQFKNTNKEVRVFRGICNGKKFVWFDKFIASRGIAIKNVDLYEIGKEIGKYFHEDSE